MAPFLSETSRVASQEPSRTRLMSGSVYIRQMSTNLKTTFTKFIIVPLDSSDDSRYDVVVH
jgi:hypothetical protein